MAGQPFSLGYAGGRTAALDPLRDSNFWLFDVGPIDNVSLPLFTPLSGFSAVSSPEITVETQEIREGNWPYTKYVVKGASVGAITLSRGVTWYSSDFWNWTVAAVQGTTGSGPLPIGGVTYRRNLLLVHFFRNLPLPVSTNETVNVLAQAGLATAGSAGLAVTAGVLAGGDTAGLGLGAGIATGAQLASLGLFGGAVATRQIGIKVPARAFLLKNCIPTRYKSGSDFDASSGQVSIQEMDVQPELIEEISLAS